MRRCFFLTKKTGRRSDLSSSRAVFSCSLHRFRAAPPAPAATKIGEVWACYLACPRFASKRLKNKKQGLRGGEM